MDEFLDDMDDEQVDDLLMPEEDETSSSQMYEHFRFVADKGQSLLRVDKFLVDRMMGATRNRIQLAAEAGCILVNDKPVKSNYRDRDVRPSLPAYSPPANHRPHILYSKGYLRG